MSSALFPPSLFPLTFSSPGLARVMSVVGSSRGKFLDTLWKAGGERFKKSEVLAQQARN